MYNLLKFLLRYHLFIYFLLLEIFCFYLIYNAKHYNEVAFLTVANAASGKVYKTYSDINSYFYLQRANDSLVNENAALRASLYDSKYDLAVDSGIKTDTSSKTVQQYTYISARVIKNSVNQAVNLIYLDRGEAQGVTKEMGVINPSGIVGKIISVTNNYSVAMSVLSKDYVSVRFLKNDFFGNVHWSGVNTTTAGLEDIPKHVQVKVGDTVVTSGFSQLFPRNVMVGTVKSVQIEPDKNFLDITINLTTDFGKLNYVYIVKNLRKQELQQLDSISVK